jgi:WhiB family redox-sensing transcriptional regulator
MFTSAAINPPRRGQPENLVAGPPQTRSAGHEEAEVSMTALDNLASWWSRAACSTADPDLFFPISVSGPAVRQVARAKAICAGCQIRRECLGYALNSAAIQGIWGGTTEAERRRLRQRLRRVRTHSVSETEARPALVAQAR